MREKYKCAYCRRDHFRDSKIGIDHLEFEAFDGIPGEPDTSSEEEDTYYGTHAHTSPVDPADRASEGGSAPAEPAGTPPEDVPVDPLQYLIDEIMRRVNEAFEIRDNRITGIEATIGQMGAPPMRPTNPQTQGEDFLQKLYDGPWGPTVKEIAKEIPSVLRSLTGGGSSDLARAITEQIAVKEAERIQKRAALVVDAIYSDRELLARDKP